MIKIVFVIGSLQIGGTETQLLETLRRLDPDRFEIRVLSLPCIGNLREKLEDIGVSFTCLHLPRVKGGLHPMSYVRIFKLLYDMVLYFREERPQIVQSYLFWANIYASIAAKIANVPIIINGRREALEKKYEKFFKLWLQNLSNVWTTAIIANSQLVKQYCLRREKFLTDEKIQVIYNGVDLNRYDSHLPHKEKKKSLGIPDDSQIVGIIGRLHPRKGHYDFLKAAACVLQSYPQTIFLIVGGDRGIQSALETFVCELGIKKSVIFTGERGDIPELLSIIDVQVCASFIEGLSNAILEGMASGKPIVATDIAGNPELVVNGQTGLLVPPGNPGRLAKAVMQLLGNTRLCSEFGNAAKQRVHELFRMERMISQTEALYQKLVDERKLS